MSTLKYSTCVYARGCGLPAFLVLYDCRVAVAPVLEHPQIPRRRFSGLGGFYSNWREYGGGRVGGGDASNMHARSAVSGAGKRYVSIADEILMLSG